MFLGGDVIRLSTRGQFHLAWPKRKMIDFMIDISLGGNRTSRLPAWMGLHKRNNS